MGAHEYQKLEVWKRSIDLVALIYRLCGQLPKSELYALSDQMKRASVSIPSNIAEGQKRYTSKDIVHFSTMALGSLAELETQLIIVNKVYEIEVNDLLGECAIISRMLHALIRGLRAKSNV